MTIQQLDIEFAKVRADRVCENIMGTFSYYYTAFRHKEILEMWAEREDSCFRSPWGVYLGYEGVRRCFLNDLVDRDDLNIERTESLRGQLNIYHLTSSVLQVAGDGQTARAVWVAPGLETRVKDRAAKQAQAYWSWSRFAADFIMVDGEWKLWHLAQAPYFLCAYERCWAEQALDFSELVPVSTADLPTEFSYKYDADCVYPEGLLEPPAQYASFADVAPGYGYR